MIMVMSGLIKMFFISTAWIHTMNLTFLTTISISSFRLEKALHTHFSVKYDNLYRIKRDSRARIGNVSLPIPDRWQGIYLLPLLVVLSIFISVFAPQSQFQHRALFPHLWTSLSCIPRRVWVPGRAMVWVKVVELHVPQVESDQDASALVHFWKKVQAKWKGSTS